jgi:hypothetical protein
MPDGCKPEPGGWNRIQLQVSDLGHAPELWGGTVATSGHAPVTSALHQGTVLYQAGA